MGSPSTKIYGLQNLKSVHSNSKPILNPAELADMEAFLGSVPGMICVLHLIWYDKPVYHMILYDMIY